MDAVEFLKKGHQMCDSFDNCDGCPGAANACCFINDASWCKNPEGVVAAVEQWAKDNPIKTRQSEFLKMFPNTKIDSEGILEISPCAVDSKYCNDDDYLEKCGTCRKIYWSQEVTDND